MEAWGFTEAKFEKIELQCDPLNVASVKMAKRLEFTLEGTQRRAFRHHLGKREMRDLMIWAKFREQWQAAQQQTTPQTSD